MTSAAKMFNGNNPVAAMHERLDAERLSTAQARAKEAADRERRKDNLRRAIKTAFAFAGLAIVAFIVAAYLGVKP